MDQREVRVGDRVLFGRPNGEQSSGEVLKCNAKSIKIRLLEDRGEGRGSTPGSVWNVAREFVRLANDAPAKSAKSTDSDLARALAKLTSAERAALAAFYSRA